MTQKKGVIMKSISMPKTVQLTEEIKEQLSKEVNETLVQQTNVDKKTKFTAVDMWNAQRNSRSASSMIRRWNLN
jgi:hypothetical protein